MKATINNTLIAKLRPTGKQYDVCDTKLTGFLVRVSAAGKISFVCQYKRGKRINIGSTDLLTATQARDKAKEILGDAVKGVYPSSKHNSDMPSLIEFIEKEYKPWIETQKKSGQKTYNRIRRCFFQKFGKKLLDELDPYAFEKWRTQRLKDNIKAATINKDMALIKASLSKAAQWKIIDNNPLAAIKAIKTDSLAIVRFWDKDEVKRLRSALDEREKKIQLARNQANKWRQERGYPLLPDLSQKFFADHLKPMVLISMNTGIRKGELFNLRWQDVDFDKAIITITGASAKSGKTRHIPLNTEALDTLYKWANNHKTITTDIVFQSNGKRFDNVTRAWKNLLQSAKIDNFRWHDMRHHFASKLVMAGVDLNTVRELLGHSDLKMTLRYAHLAPEHKAQAVATLLDK